MHIQHRNSTALSVQIAKYFLNCNHFGIVKVLLLEPAIRKILSERNKKMKKIFLSVLSLLVLAAFTSCSQNMESTSNGAAKGDVFLDKPAGGVEDVGEAEDGKYEIAGDAALPEIAPEGFEGMADAAYDMAGDDYSGGFAGEGEFGGTNGIAATAGTLTAGEWVDNDHYTFWQSLYQKDEAGWEIYRKRWDRTYSSRIFVTVTASGKPAENETITLTDNNGRTLWTAKTDNEGKAYLFCSPSELSAGDLTVTTSSGSMKQVSGENDTVTFDTEKSGSSKKSLDLALIVDTTGSMSDELRYLQKELESVINRAAKDNGNIPVRLSVSFYRDDGDEYVVRDFDFTDNISEAIKNLNEQVADGGGDTPEKVNAALDTAINKLSWEENSTKLAFIILDAPPHSNDEKAVKDMNVLTEQAAANGIRLIPILASGGDKETEFLMRDFALKTGGSYLFLTDDSGVSAGQHIEPTVGDYTVEKLNDLMVKVIDRYLKNYDDPADFKDETVETKAPETELPQMNAADGVTMKLADGTPIEGSLDFELINNTENQFMYSYHFDLEQLKDGQWTKIEPSEDIAVIEVEVILEAYSANIYNVPIKAYYGELPSGEYRIVLELISYTGEKVTVYGEFGVSIIID